ncbi:MAG TPA: HAMP domain-containing sensor histidine kinase [Candidatus Angelobacter sp.]|nr:HAMP domain-containing sensor histidine kinase [Candidatus Angelobacter sp.]
MERISHFEQLLLRSRRLSWVLIGVTLVILAATILLATLQLRARTREQIVRRDGEVLHAVALMQLEADAPEIELLGPITDPENQLSVVLKTSRLKGVLAARLFGANGRFVGAFPFDVREATVDAHTLATLNRLTPVSRFLPDVRWSSLFLPEEPAPEKTMSVLEVNVPLHMGGAGPLIGIAQFNIEGSTIAAEFARLDRHLALQGLIAFFVGGGILTLAIAWAFRRLRQTHQLLAERTDSLLRANQELALMARSSAVGAITSHLIHGLKNPLAGLQSFMSNIAPDPTSTETDWAQALTAAHRMQGLINQVVNVLREEDGAVQYEITLHELAELVSTKVRPLSTAAGVRFDLRANGGAILPNRIANLVMLILVNLAQNALQATHKDGAVTLSIEERENCIVCEVCDEGPGLSPEMATALFTPCKSTKEGGSGIGLAISKQLANHLGADLELKTNSPGGCVFMLTVPTGALAGKSGRASSTPVC